MAPFDSDPAKSSRRIPTCETSHARLTRPNPLRHLLIVRGESIAKVVPLRGRVTDAELVQAHRRDDPTAMERLYRRHVESLLGMATRLLGQRAEADDAIHDAFVRILDRLDELRDPSRFRAWAFRIAVNECRKRLRRRRRYVFGAPIPNHALERIAARCPDPERAVDLNRLAATIASLPVDERIAFSLRHVEGHALEECAVLVDCSLSTLKRRLKRAERKLRFRSTP